ncbi:MAG TPA: tRNA glutamyl-Q(34) synthetase GluQRS [Solirubrobacteraceae bacterium]|nr:tRNA glutamyl-Q(34) synthetase GluQRS [Solirubrobacteraceae bacterium]
MTGRFAPTPSGPLHIGNLRTALVAWLFARSAGSRFLLRIEDLDAGRARPEHEAVQLADLAAIGLDWDGPVVRQSERGDRYAAAIALLDTYPCFCTRAEIREAASAPHGPLPEGAYPGTCRELGASERADRERSGRPPALRVRGTGAQVAFDDRLMGRHEGAIDDFVVRRNDGAFAYNLAVVVDDADQGVEQVVRGADLLDSTPRQLWLAGALGLPAPSHAHVPLVLGADGERLAKRHGAVTLADRDEPPRQTLALLARSLGLAEAGEEPEPHELVARFDPERLPSVPWIWSS